MEGKDIAGIGIGIFIFLAVVSFGVLFTSIMSYTARDDTTVGLNAITVATNNSLTDFGTSYPFVQTVTGCINSTDAADTLNAANYTVVTGNSGGSGGFILLDSGVDFVGEDVNCTVYYKKSTTGSTAMFAFFVTFGTLASLFVIVVLFIFVKSIIKVSKK